MARSTAQPAIRRAAGKFLADGTLSAGIVREAAKRHSLRAPARPWSYRRNRAMSPGPVRRLRRSPAFKYQFAVVCAAGDTSKAGIRSVAPTTGRRADPGAARIDIRSCHSFRESRTEVGWSHSRRAHEFSVSCSEGRYHRLHRAGPPASGWRTVREAVDVSLPQ